LERLFFQIVGGLGFLIVILLVLKNFIPDLIRQAKELLYEVKRAYKDPAIGGRDSKSDKKSERQIGK
jgi:hypothetical protein